MPRAIFFPEKFNSKICQYYFSSVQCMAINRCFLISTWCTHLIYHTHCQHLSLTVSQEQYFDQKVSRMEFSWCLDNLFFVNYFEHKIFNIGICLFHNQIKQINQKHISTDLQSQIIKKIMKSDNVDSTCSKSASMSTETKTLSTAVQL